MKSKEMIYEVVAQHGNFSFLKMVVLAAPLLLCVVAMLFSEHALAQKADALRDHANAIEDFLTGNIMRGIAIGGNIWGLIQSYMKSSVMVLSGVIGIDLIGCGMLAWVKTTWAFLI